MTGLLRAHLMTRVRASGTSPHCTSCLCVRLCRGNVGTSICSDRYFQTTFSTQWHVHCFLILLPSNAAQDTILSLTPLWYIRLSFIFWHLVWNVMLCFMVWHNRQFAPRIWHWRIPMYEIFLTEFRKIVNDFWEPWREPTPPFETVARNLTTNSRPYHCLISEYLEVVWHEWFNLWFCKEFCDKKEMPTSLNCVGGPQILPTLTQVRSRTDHSLS